MHTKFVAHQSFSGFVTNSLPHTTQFWFVDWIEILLHKVLKINKTFSSRKISLYYKYHTLKHFNLKTLTYFKELKSINKVFSDWKCSKQNLARYNFSSAARNFEQKIDKFLNNLKTYIKDLPKVKIIKIKKLKIMLKTGLNRFLWQFFVSSPKSSPNSKSPLENMCHQMVQKVAQMATNQLILQRCILKDDNIGNLFQNRELHFSILKSKN